MKIILIKNINKLGRSGEIKEVSEGYGRNYLLPQGLAIIANKKNIRYQSQIRQCPMAKTNVNSQTSEQCALKLKPIILNFEEKADEKDNFFAGVTKEKISQALSNYGFQLKPKQILLEKPIKKPGLYNIEVDLPGGLKGKFRIVTKKINK